MSIYIYNNFFGIIYFTHAITTHSMSNSILFNILFIFIPTDFQIKNQLIGCFKWQENTLFNMKFKLSNTNTPNVCSAICNNAVYQFAGVMG